MRFIESSLSSNFRAILQQNHSKKVILRALLKDKIVLLTFLSKENKVETANWVEVAVPNAEINRSKCSE